jgi:hypothetical protein
MTFYFIYICSVLSGRGLCVGLITRPEKSYRGWCVWVWSWSPERKATTRNRVEAPQDHIYNCEQQQEVWSVWIKQHEHVRHTTPSYLCISHISFPAQSKYVVSIWTGLNWWQRASFCTVGDELPHFVLEMTVNIWTRCISAVQSALQLPQKLSARNVYRCMFTYRRLWSATSLGKF